MSEEDFTGSKTASFAAAFVYNFFLDPDVKELCTFYVFAPMLYKILLCFFFGTL